MVINLRVLAHRQHVPEMPFISAVTKLVQLKMSGVKSLLENVLDILQ